LRISGTDSDNYSLTQPTATADIRAKGLTVTVISAATEASDSYTLSLHDALPISLSGVVSGDTVNLSTAGASGAFGTKAVGTSKSDQMSTRINSSPDSSKYSVTHPKNTTDISAKGLTVTGITAANKLYDGNTSATI